MTTVILYRSEYVTASITRYTRGVQFNVGINNHSLGIYTKLGSAYSYLLRYSGGFAENYAKSYESMAEGMAELSAHVVAQAKKEEAVVREKVEEIRRQNANTARNEKEVDNLFAVLATIQGVSR